MIPSRWDLSPKEIKTLCEVKIRLGSGSAPARQGYWHGAEIEHPEHPWPDTVKIQPTPGGILAIIKKDRPTPAEWARLDEYLVSLGFMSAAEAKRLGLVRAPGTLDWRWGELQGLNGAAA